MLRKKIIINEENKETLELTSTVNYYTEWSLQVDYNLFTSHILDFLPEEARDVNLYSVVCHSLVSQVLPQYTT